MDTALFWGVVLVKKKVFAIEQLLNSFQLSFNFDDCLLHFVYKQLPRIIQLFYFLLFPDNRTVVFHNPVVDLQIHFGMKIF